ncbi:TIGR04376 family protein [Roseofilum casamattae]|uniref:TIGR04376 family protein n=1 Tax=Roseofilum casamattae BLCC-M143 TaxID=3022442 RepID=A0ABT7BUA5_9CYAN|nr:TIGR04376 family protein [Roseofilum casamattae]MDJ1182773.1 TIGR04376 family protein [Roseofilum casamattae BLCC-M143]
MGLFDDVSRFLEERLDEFLRKHPQLELSILEDQINEQQEDTLRLIVDLQRQEKQAQEEIMATAQEIQRWHTWVQKATAKGRPDLAQAAQERENSLLHKGNQLWGKMQGCKQRIAKAKELYQELKKRKEEIQARAAQVKEQASQSASDSPPGWRTGYTPSGSSADPLEEEFQRWEAQRELEDMKEQMGK